MSTWNKNPLYQSVDNITNEPKWVLPEGWLELEDPNGKKYYACTKTKHTQWLHPGIPIGTPMPNGLPYGWDKKIDAQTNKEYFVCHVGRFNTWSPPVGRRDNFFK